METGRKVKRSEAAELLRTWECSGEPMARWCAARGLNWHSLNAFKGWGLVEPEPEFTELVVAAAGPGSLGRYRIELGDFVVEVDDHFRADTLRRLVQVVATC